MESLILAASVVFPLLVYMVVGGLARKCKIMTEEQFKAFNGMIFRIFIPLALFFDVYKSDLKEVLQPRVFGFVFISIVLVFIIAWIGSVRGIKEKRDAITVAQSIYRSNYVLFGSAVAASLCGESGTALVAALAAMVVPLFNVLAVILFEVSRGGNVTASKIIINIFKNPLVDAGILGAIFSLLGLSLPTLLEQPLMRLGNSATPLALVTLGGLLSFESIKRHKKYLMVAVISRLIAVPAVVLILAVLLGFRGEALVAILAIFAAPTAVVSAPMAQSMGGNGALAGEIVAVTSVCCILTLFCFVFALSQMGMF